MRLTRVFFETHMALGFEGLRKIASEAKSKAQADTNLLFMNKKMTSFKIIVNNTYIVYFKNGTRRIPLDALKFLPQQFGGTDMEMNEAIRKSLMRKLEIEE